MFPSSLKHHLLDEVFSSAIFLPQYGADAMSPSSSLAGLCCQASLGTLWCCLLLLLPWESLSLMEETLSQVMHNCGSRPSFTCMSVSLLMLREFPLLAWSKICTPLRVWMNICLFLVLSQDHIISSPSSSINKNIFLNLSLKFTDQSFYTLYSALIVFCFYVSFSVLYFFRLGGSGFFFFTFAFLCKVPRRLLHCSSVFFLNHFLLSLKELFYIPFQRVCVHQLLSAPTWWLIFTVYVKSQFLEGSWSLMGCITIYSEVGFFFYPSLCTLA